MSKDKVVSLENPEWNADVLTDFLRKQSEKSSAKPAVNVAGFKRRQTYSTSSPNTVRPKKNNISMISKWQKPERRQRRHLTSSLKTINSNIAKPSSTCAEKVGTNYVDLRD